VIRLLLPLVCLLALSACQDPAATEMAKGNLLVNKGQLEDAVKAYQEAVRLSPGKAKPLELLGNALFDLKRYPESRQAYIRGIAAEPGALESHLGLARVSEATGDRPGAVAELSKVLEMQPQNLYARLSRANFELEDGKAAAAREDALAATVSTPKSKEALFTLGRAELALADLPQAELTFTKLTQLAPSSGQGAYGLALVAAQRGDKAGVVSHLGEVMGKQEKPPPDQILADPAFARWRGDPDLLAVVH
jgi:tetratricopeptide (TPR) repeat protein